MSTSRRKFFKIALTALAGITVAPRAVLAQSTRKKRIAAIVVVYGLRTHADNIVTRLLEGYRINDEVHAPDCEVASLYVHRITKADLSKRLADAYRLRYSPTIEDALTLGTGELAVDGVVIVSQDGEIPFDKNPYKLFFSQIVDVFRKSGRSVPVYNDKHLSHDWDEAKWMVQQSRELGFPLLAGSVIAVTFRRPELDFPIGTRFVEALAACPLPPIYLDALGVHGFELLQAMVERRAGGEVGIRAVQCLEGGSVWKAADEGLWSRELLEAALARSGHRVPGRAEDLIEKPAALLIEYRDGLRGAVLNSAGASNDFTFAARIHGDDRIHSTWAYRPLENSNDFGILVNYFEQMMRTGKTAYPIERNLLTAGAIDFLMRSRRAGHTRLETPELDVRYQPPARSAYASGLGS